MNKIFKVIWNEARNAYVVVSEIAKNHGSKSCSTKKLLAMLIATGVMTCASFDVLAEKPVAAKTAAQQYVALKAKEFDVKPSIISPDRDEWDAQQKGEKKIGGYTYRYDRTNKYWVRKGYVLTVDKNGGKYTQLSDNAIRADVAYTGTGVPEGILQSVTSTVARNGVVTHSGDSLQKVTAGSYAGVSHGGGTEVAGSWNYIINDSSWENSDAEYKDGYVDLIDNNMPRGFKTTDSGLNWDEVKQTYTYKGKAVDYRNMYVIDDRLGVFTNADGSEVYTGTVYGKNNEILMTVKDNGKFYSYWAASVTDPSATMETYPVSKYNSDLAVIDKNIKDLNKDIIKEVTLTKDTNSAIIRLVRNGGKAVDGAITVTSGGGTGGSDAAHDTFVKISNGTTEQTFATGSKVEAIGSKDATTGIKINGQDYTIKSGSKVSVTKNAAEKTTTITVDGTETTITDTDTTYTKGDGIEISGANAISVSKNLTGMQSIKGAGGTINLVGSAITVNETTFNKDGRIQNVANGTETKDAVNFGQLQEVSNVANAGWNVSTNGGTATNVAPGARVDFSGAKDASGYQNIQVTNDGTNVKVALNKELTGLTSVTTNNAYVTNVDASKNESVTNVEYVKNQIADAALSAGDGISITDKKINVKLKEGEQNLVVNQDGLSLNTTLNGMAAINGAGGTINLAGDAITVNQNTFNKDGRIQNVANGTEKTDAVNYGQLQEVSNVANAGWNVSTNGGTATNVAPGAKVDFSGAKDASGYQNIQVTNDGTNVKVALNKELTGLTSVTTNNAYVTNVDASKNESVTNVEYVKNQIADAALSAGEGISITEKKINVKLKDGEQNLVVNQDGLSLNTTLNGMQSIIGAGTGAGSISFEGGNVKVNQNTFNSDGRIQGVVAGEDDTDAVNVGQLNKVVAAGDTDVHIKAGEYKVDDKNKVAMNLVDKAGNDEGTVTITGVAKTEDVAVVYDANGSLKSTNAKSVESNAIALGKDASAVNDGGVALGNEAYAGNKGTSLGTKAKSGREGATVVGYNTNSSGLYSTVVGTDATINTNGKTVYTKIVQGAAATVVGAMNKIDNTNGEGYSGVANNVMGAANTIEGSNGVTIQGSGNTVTDAYKDMKITLDEGSAILRGDYSVLAKKQSGAVAVVGGANTVSKQTDSTVIGYDNQLAGGAENISHDVFLAGSHNKLNNVSDSIVMGNKNTINGVSNVISFGHQNTISANNAVAIGNGAGVSVEGGVALGVGSVASTAAGALGYGAAEGETSIAWNATHGAVSVGSSVEGKEITRQITNVAAGTADTDAVNVAQLKKVSEAAASASQGWKLSTGKGKAVNVAPGDTVEFDGDANIQVGNDGNKVSVTLKKQLTGIQSIIGAGEGAGSISFADGGIKFNNKVTIDNTGKISGVANGIADNDAVNVSQLNKVSAAAKTEVVKGTNIASVVASNATDDGHTVYTVNAKGTSVSVDGNFNLNTTTDDETNVTNYGISLKDSVTIGGTHAVTINGTDGTVTGLTNTTWNKDSITSGRAATEDQLQAVATEAGKHTTLSNGKNTTVKPVTTADGHLEYKVDVNDELKDIKSIIGAGEGAGSISFANDGIKFNNKVTIDNTGKISGVANGIADNDAVNVSQLNKVSAAAKTEVVKGTNIASVVASNATDDGHTVYTVNAKGTSVSVDGNFNLNTTTDDETNVTNYGISLKDSVTIGGTHAVTINGTDGTVTGLTNTTWNKDSITSGRAATEDQLQAVATEAGKHTTLSNGKNTTVESTVKDGQTDYKVNVAGDLTDITSVANGDSKINLNKDSIIISNGNKYFAITNSGIGMSYIGADYSAKSIMLGENGTTISGGLNVAGSKITGVAAGEADTDAVNVSQLKEAVEAGNTDTHIKPGEYGVGADNTVNMDVVDKNGNKVDTVTIKDVAKASDVGNVNNIADDIKNGEGHTTVVDAVNNLNNKLDNKVGDLNYVEGGKGNYVTNGENTTTSIGKLDQALKDVAATAAKHTTVTQGNNITVTKSDEPNENGGENYNVALNKDIKLDSVTTGDTVMNNDGVKVGTDVSLNKDGLKVGDKVSVSATAVTAGQTSINNDGLAVGPNTSLKADELKVDGKTYIDKNGLNANGQHITNVKAGEADTDAVNYGQLKDTNNRINGVENQVISNTNRINQLGNRVNKVGAGAAALAALHPMDFDPDDKLTFSAGYGNYGGENAAAIGAYYRPDEKVMFSVAGTVGNGENMVNAGVSFALDRTNHVSNSRTALAREVIDLRGQLAVMGAKMAKMEKAFGMLDETKTKLFPDIPANHWAYEYIAKLAGNGYIEGYPDGNFGGDRLMTRYEFAAMLYRAIENGAALEEKIIKEFEPELGRIRVDRISGEDGDRDKIERVRVNDTKGERDHYGNKLAK